MKKEVGGLSQLDAQILNEMVNLKLMLGALNPEMIPKLEQATFEDVKLIYLQVRDKMGIDLFKIDLFAL
jgi:hypothetical protein